MKILKVRHSYDTKIAVRVGCVGDMKGGGDWERKIRSGESTDPNLKGKLPIGAVVN